MTYNLAAEQIEQSRDGYMQGKTVSQLARRLDKRQASMYQRIQASGGSGHDPETGGPSSDA